MTLHEKIVQDYKAIASTEKKSTLESSDLQGAIAYAKNVLKTDPNNPTLKPWLVIIAQRESENAAIRSQLDELKDFVDNSGKRIIPAPIIEKSIFSTEKIDTNNSQITPENIKDIKTLLSYRRKGHIDAAISSGFFPIPANKKATVENYIENKFGIINGAIEEMGGRIERRNIQNAQEAYKDIIYTVTHGGAMDRPAGQGEEIKFRMNGTDVQDAKDYLLNLINKEIPATNTTVNTVDKNITEKVPDATKQSDEQKDKKESKEVKNTPKFDLQKSEKYAIQELKKSGKTIKDLQEALNKMNNSNLTVNGKFDQATLDAVVDFQSKIINSKYGADGLVGSEETIPALFGIPAVPNTNQKIVPKAPKNNASFSSVPKSGTEKGIVPLNPTESSDKIDNSVEGIKKQLDAAYLDFQSYAQKIDIIGGGIRLSKEDIESQRKILNSKIETLIILLAKHASNSNISINTTVSAYRLNLSYYLDGGLKGIDNNLYKNIGLSQNLALSVINQDKNRIDFVPQGQQAIFDTLETLKNTPLGNTIADALAKNPDKNLFDILSNPMVKGGWQSAYEKVFERYLKKMDSQIDAISPKDLPTEHQKKALEQIRDIRGKGGWFDFKSENVTAMWQFAKYGGAILGGIAGSALTMTGVGSIGGAPLVALSASVLTGAVVTTGATLLAQGYHGSLGEVVGDAGINLISFGGGAILFKIASGARVASFASKGALATGLVYGAEGAGNVGIGVGTDMLRAKLTGTDLQLWDSIKMNLVWAALPAALRMKGKGVDKHVTSENIADVTQVNNLVESASAQVALGKSPKITLEKIKDPLSRLKFWGEKNNKVQDGVVHNGSPDLNVHGNPIVSNKANIKLDQTKQLQIESNMNLSDAERIIQAEKRLGLTMNQVQKEALLEAHYADTIMKKGRILARKGDYSKEEIRILMEEGYAGRRVGLAPGVNPSNSIKANTNKNTETVAHAQKTVAAHAEHPQAAHAALENVAHSSKKMGETFSMEWVEKMSHTLGKPVKWVADQSVGPIFRIITGNNPSALISLANPMGGWTGKASTYGKNLFEHWKSPVRNSINLFVTGDRKDGQGIISAVAKNVMLAGGITALDYFAVPNDQANTTANMAQNYYEMILLGWLGVVIMENEPIVAAIKDTKDWISDRMQARPL